MAKCAYCGEKAGIGNDVCRSCFEAREAAAAAEAERKAQEDAIKFDEFVAQKVDAWERSARERIQKGEKVYLYRYVYVTVDSTLNGQPYGPFNFAPIQKSGLEGWKVESIIPKTTGVGLKNVSYGASRGETWGAGVGGIVTAVYVVLSKEIISFVYPDNVAARKLADDLVRLGFELS
jgi:hypothetical protein